MVVVGIGDPGEQEAQGARFGLPSPCLSQPAAGCKHLKAILQWLAASQAGRPVHYFVFGDVPLAAHLEALLAAIKQVRFPVIST